MTESELLFERFCSDRGIPCSRVQEAETQRPDYRVHLTTVEVIVEVKQIDPTAEERRLLATPCDDWNPENVYHWGIPGERVRKKISAAIPQLKALSTGSNPTLLVLYDAVKFWPELLDEHALKVAMYGIETALISSEAAPEGGAVVLARWHGQRQRLTPKHNTSLSAIAIMRDQEGGVALSVYHNFYASNPLSTEALAAVGIPQYRMSGLPSESFPAWELIP